MLWTTGVILQNDASDRCAGYRRYVTLARPAGLTERRWLVTVALIVCAAAVMLMLVASPPGHDKQRIFVVMLPCVAVVALRRRPLPVLAVVTAGTGLEAATGTSSLPLGLLLGLTLYFSVLDVARRRSVKLALAVAAVMLVALGYAAVHQRAMIAADAVEDLVPLAAAWFIADAVAARRRYQAGLVWQMERERAADVQRERVRIAREMHDVVAHTLAVITVQAGVGRRLADRQPGKATAALESIETIGRTAQEELRAMLGLLRDGETTAAPLAPAPGIDDIKDLVDTVRVAGTPVELRMTGTERRLSPALELSVYRVVQEALTNVVKHAPGARATVELGVRDGKICLDVRDDGAITSGAGCPGPGHGITGMRERIGAFGGWLAAGPDRLGGFRVTAEVPVEGAAS
jgi:signal transduction histidine kinase